MLYLTVILIHHFKESVCFISKFIGTFLQIFANGFHPDIIFGYAQAVKEN